MLSRVLSIIAVGLAAAALFVAAREPDPQEASAAAPAPVPVADPCRELDSPEELQELSRRLDSLETALAGLGRRVEALESQKAVAATSPVAPAAARDEVQQLREDVDALLTGEALDTEAGRERLKQVVRSIQEQAALERARFREAAREQARVERFNRFAQEARLSPTQEQDLRRLLDEEQQKREALRREAQEQGRARAQIRAEEQKLRQATDDEAQRLLGSDQIEAYRQFRQLREGQRQLPAVGRGAPGRGRGAGERGERGERGAR